MNNKNIINNIQQQANAAWIDFLKFERLKELVENLTNQDINLENALQELQKIRDFVGAPEHILGSAKTKHGEIAENMQVHISNAQRLVDGLKSQHTFESVGRTAPEDYLYNGIQIQQKFYNGTKNTLDAIQKHLETYPDFMKNGGEYDIPKDQYEHIIEILNKPSSELSRSEYAIVKWIRDWESKNNISFTDKVNPTTIDYADAQIGNAENTVQEAEKDIKSKDEKKRKEIQENSKPSLKEGVTVTVVSAAAEGSLQFLFAVYNKLKTGKRMPDFTESDWKEIGIDTAKGAGTGALRGAGTYVLTNFANMSGTVANGYISSAIGIVNQANQLRKGNLTEEDFFINSQVICLDAAISVIGSTLGQIIIPVPILGAVIGSTVTNFMSGLCKEHLSQKEQEIIEMHRKELQTHIETLNTEYKEIVLKIDKEYQRFSSLAELAFDINVNISFLGSISLAEYVGVKDNKILKSKEDIDNYFLS